MFEKSRVSSRVIKSVFGTSVINVLSVVWFLFLWWVENVKYLRRYGKVENLDIYFSLESCNYGLPKKKRKIIHETYGKLIVPKKFKK